MTHLHALLSAPFDRGVFAEVHGQKLRRTVGYLFLLIAIATASTTIWFTLGLRGLVRRVLPELDKLPTITIRDGEASANVPQPWRHSFGWQDGNEVVLIIDTTGVVTDLDDHEVGLLLMKRELLVKGDDGAKETIELARLGDVTIGPHLVKRWLARAQRIAPFVFAAVAFLLFTILRWLQALVLTLVALVAGLGRRRKLGFGALLTVATYALTLPAWLAALRPFVPLRVPHFWLISAALAVAYAIAGVRRIPDEE
ncbi:MAG TPA: DUF1189 domain-containing protein [Polyangia bacterium]|nr:DUF1189 domain-containing protein [Polyangia bacterium]